MEEKLSDASHEREVARAQVEQRDSVIADLRRQLEQQSAKMDQMKAAQEQSETALRNADAGRQELIQQRTEAEQKFNAAQLSAQALQTKLDSIAEQSSQDAKRAATLDAKVNELTNLLHQRDAAVDQQQELLAHDRDIRELMGARDLYVAEVYDVARTGATQKALWARVLHEGEVAHLLRLRLGSTARREECQHVSGLGPARTGPGAGVSPRYLLRGQCRKEAVGLEAGRPETASAN